MSNNSNLEFRKIKSLNFLYEINENGTIVRNVKSKKHLKIELDMHHSKKGYYVTFVRLGDSRVVRVRIHKAVAECWLGDCPEGYEVDHINRNPHDNHYSNLRYVTKSEQAKNRDHSRISATGTRNLEAARKARMKPVLLKRGDTSQLFESYADCARFLGELYNESPEKFRYRLKAKRSHIYDFDVVFLNAETGHGRSTEQGTVH